MLTQKRQMAGGRAKPKSLCARRCGAKKQDRIQSALEISGQMGRPDWVEVDDKQLTGVLRSLPEREDVLPDINENLVVELYSK